MKDCIYTIKVIYDSVQDYFIARTSDQRYLEGQGTTPGEALSDLAERLDLWHNESEEDNES